MKKNLILIATGLVLSTGAFSQAKETPPAGSEPKNFVLPDREEILLENGVKAVLVPYGEIPKATIRIVVDAGNIHEKENQVWLSDLTGNLMKEGSTNYSAREIADRMANMGGDLNIRVDPHHTNLQASVLYEFVPDALNLLADVLIHPLFPDSETERLKNDLKRNLSISLTRPGPVARQEFYRQMFPDHPYGRLYPTEEMIEGYSTEEVRAFYDENFGGRRTTVYVAGMFNKSEVAKAIRKAFESWKEGPETRYETVQPVTTGRITLLDRPGAPQSTLLMGLPVVDPSHEDYIAVEVMNMLLGGSFSSRITANLREDKGYTYSPYSSVNTYYHSAIWVEQADVTKEFTGASLTEIRKEIEHLQNEPPSEEELDGIKNYEAGLFVLRNSSPGGIISQLMFLDLNGLGYDYLVKRVENIYAVTPGEVQEMARKYILPDEMTIVIVGDKKQVQPQVEAYEK